MTEKSKTMDLLGTAVHDLKIPLASIKSFADLVRQDGELTDRQEHYLGRIQLAVENMTNLVNDLSGPRLDRGGHAGHESPL